MASFVVGLRRFLGALALMLLAHQAAAAEPLAFVGRSGSKLVVNGSPFLFNGFNAYWLMNVASEDQVNVSKTLSEAAAAGLTVCRTWAFNDGGNPALQSSPGVYNEKMFQGLDFAVSEAKNHGIRLVMSLINNFKDFGGKTQYVQWARDAGEAIKTDDDFYTNAKVKQYYKNHVLKVLTRVNTITKVAYKDDPTIMTWDLMNEPRCPSEPSGQTVTAWVKEMAAYTKSIDSKHLLQVGFEGFYGSSTPDKIGLYNPGGYKYGTDFIIGNQVNEIDYTTIHAYPDAWLPQKSEEERKTFLQQWISSHFNDSVKVIGKPMVFEEFGKSTTTPGYSQKVRDDFLSYVYGMIYSDAETSGGSFSGGLLWQIMGEGMKSYYDGFAIVLPRDSTTTAVIKKQSDAMAALKNRLSGSRH
ncbi:mannan endo-1,4-beta-mannosidase 5-like [Musa acuminata AAA Group]|uniref:mannan endo-1,4-beta-mannosidase 5-like n=1 Tax=Musa acuminata AAA Group TaxID=214697 RepID=UPI0031D4445E